MFVIEKMKLMSFSLFLDAFPPRPTMPFGQLNVIVYKYTTRVKGVLGLGGERGCTSERRQQSSDKNRPLCKMVVFIVHQLYKYILDQKRNAAYKTYILYGGSFTNLSQTICHSLSADSLSMSFWGCTSYHCHRTKLIHQFKPTFL